MTHLADTAPIAAYYGRKTESILRKYGPGPRIHFHIGWFADAAAPAAAGLDAIRRALVCSQEDLLARAAEVWDAPACLSGRVLDVGAGFGGGSIYWADRHGADVTAVTIVPAHAGWIAQLAERAGVGARVRAMVCNACEVASSEPFDAVVAMESPCYLPRERWFARLARLVRPGGWVCIEDTFLGRTEWAAPFDSYWKTSIGSRDEYVAAAAQAGFQLDRDVDVTAATVPFWELSQAWSRAQLADRSLAADERHRLAESIACHGQMRRAWQERGIEVRFLRFQRGA